MLRHFYWYQLLLLAVIACGPSSVWAAPWWQCDWQYRSELTVQSTESANDLVVSLALGSSDFNSAYVFSSDGADIRVLAADNSSELDFHLREWDAASRQALINVRIPSMAANTPQTVYLYYGNINAAAAGGAGGVVTADDPAATYVNSGWRYDVRQSTLDPSNEAEARAEFENASSPSGYGCSTVNSLNGLTKRNVFGGNQYNYGLYAQTWFEVTTPGVWEFRAGTDFGLGGDIFINGVGMTNRWNEDIWWARDWNNGDVLTGSVSLSAGFHQFEALGFEGCCDGPISVQYRSPGSSEWRQLDSANLTAVTPGCPVGSQSFQYVQTDAPNRFGGTVFLDNGDSGIAHNAVREGDEAALGATDITVQVINTNVSSTVLTKADGSWHTCFLDDAVGQDVQVSMPIPAEHYNVSEGVAATNTDSPLNATVIFGVNGPDNYLDINLGFIELPKLTSDNTISVGAGMTGLLPHRYTASSDSEVSFQVSQLQHQQAGAYSYAVFQDLDCDGNMDSPAVPLSSPVATSVGQDVCLLVQVDGSPSIVESSLLELRIDASTDFNGIALSHSNTNFDTVNGAEPVALVLLKSVCNANESVCDLQSGAGFSETNIGKPNDELVYRLEFSSLVSTLSNVAVYDNVPAFTKLKPSSIAVVSQPSGMSCTIVEPADQTQSGFTGTVKWECDGQVQPTESGVVAFSVLID